MNTFLPSDIKSQPCQPLHEIAVNPPFGTVVYVIYRGLIAEAGLPDEPLYGAVAPVVPLAGDEPWDELLGRYAVRSEVFP